MIGRELAEVPAAAPVGLTAPAGRTLRARVTLPALVIALLMVAGLVVRLIVAHQSLFADELSTYWIVATHSFSGVISLMYGTSHIPHAEITPPMIFLLSWLTAQISHSPELLRAPSLVAGTLTIPVIYVLGLRTVGRPAALLAAALTTLSPFMIDYSAEARSYAVMMLLTTLAMLAMLLALDTRRTRWWVVYAVCSCGAFYTHYTSAFVLLAQLVWLLWVHPAARRPALLANLAAAAGVLPWVPGLINDLKSPTTQILSALSPFTVHDVQLSLTHWAIGFPYVEAGGLSRLPGKPALVLLGLAAIIVVAGIAAGIRRLGAKEWLGQFDRRVLLVFGLAMSVPIGEAVVSAVSTHLFGVRNLAASWPALSLSCSVLITAAGSRLRLVAAGLAIVALALGASKLLTVHFERTDFRAAADFIARHARPGDVVIDGTGVLSPGPLTGLDLVLHAPVKVFRAGAPDERDHPFGFLDPIPSSATATARAIAAAPGGRVIVVEDTPVGQARAPLIPFPSRYQLVQTRVYPQFVGLTIDVWDPRSQTGR
jgi:uncharacterized membrane protein